MGASSAEITTLLKAWSNGEQPAPLLALWQDADPDLPTLTRAKAEYAAPQHA